MNASSIDLNACSLASEGCPGRVGVSPAELGVPRSSAFLAGNVRLSLASVLILFFGGFLSFASASEPKKNATPAADAPTTEQLMAPRWVVILGVYKSFPEAKTDGEKFAKASKVPFSMNGRIFDKKGLRYPDKFEDELYAGQYAARRGNSASEGKQELEQHISIERSDAYEGFAKGYYIVIGTIAETKEDGLAQETKFKAFAPDTYVKKTRIYMGCMH